MKPGWNLNQPSRLIVFRFNQDFFEGLSCTYTYISYIVTLVKTFGWFSCFSV
ncbi:hypothetical protein CROQUDRAFT_661550, partial [Cronartium quercuum f. sp. fusiforme G11]